MFQDGGPSKPESADIPPLLHGVDVWPGLLQAPGGKDTCMGTLHLQIAAPFYAVYGAGMALYFAMQGVGNPVPAVLANAARLAASAGGAYAAVTWFDAGPAGVFAATAAGFLLYGALVLWAFLRTPDPSGGKPSGATP